ncbi:MAG: ABC transporter substrate-binding protein [Halanaerobiales bacterium]|nr:ABC transporter substrate-binding protein [Halanaerobiales bacterium]
MKKKTISILLVLVFTLSLVSVGAGTAMAAEDTDTIDFGYVQWPGVTVKTHVAKKVLDHLGYETAMTSGSQAIVFKGMDTGDLDIFLGNWMPTMKIHFDKYSEKGSVKAVRNNLLDVVYRTAVPEYVYEAGVTSLADLQEHADKFNSTIYGIEPGNEGNLIIKNAIDNNTYNLDGWTLQASSTAGMLTSVKRAVNNEEWIAFNAWKPHYMNVMFDIKYLDDPEGIWGSGERVQTVVRTGFEEENPNVYKFLEQFKVTAPMQNEWIDMYKRQEMDPEVVAEKWIANNLDVVNQWVYGVESTDGRMARKVLAEKVSN